MRVAQVTATFPPYWAGTGNVVYHNARVLTDLGHEVTVFTADGLRDASLSFPFPVVRLPALFRIGNAPLTPALLANLKGFEIIHLHYPYIFGSELTLAASRLFATPLCISYHNQLEETNGTKKILFTAYNRVFEQRLLAAASLILAVNLDHFLSRHPDLGASRTLRELPNGVDTRTYSPRDKGKAKQLLGFDSRTPLALFVGALDKAHRAKNLQGLVRALAGLDDQDARLLVVGDGDLRPALESLAVKLRVEGRVHFLGARRPDELPLLYSAVDVTVLPSIGQESFGMPVIESFACGTTVIASALPGLRSVMRSIGAGKVVPPGAPNALRAALREVLGDLEAARRDGELGRRSVAKNYDWPVIGQKLDSLYGEVRRWSGEMILAR